MAVYKLFASADASIYSKQPSINTGLDEILEVAVLNLNNQSTNFVDPVPQEPLLSDNIRRSLVYFSNEDLDIIQTLTTGSFSANLRLYLANAENLTTTYNLEVGQVAENWNMGTGKYFDYPNPQNGVCWYSPDQFNGTYNSWTNTTYYLTPGGGNWTGTLVSQSFSYKDNKDLNINVTGIVNSWLSGSTNAGFIIKHPIAIESNSGSYIGLKFFSVDTHTIYPPTLDIKWDDSIYITGSLSTINSSFSVITLANNHDTFKYGTGKYKVIINARDQYPVRTFTTSSFYTTNKALPSSSYWSIQDVKTEEVVIDFDTQYTKISCDGVNSYFNLYMNGLEPERYYKIVIKVILSDGESYLVDNNLIFKIVR